MDFLRDEFKNLEADFQAAYGYLTNNWRRILAWAAVWYVGSMWGPAAAGKAQAMLKVIGL